MAKKTVLKSATKRVPAQVPATPAPTIWQRFVSRVDSFLSEIFADIRRAIRFVFFTLPLRIWAWLRRLPLSGLLNCILLLAIIILFSILIGRNFERRDNIDIGGAPATIQTQDEAARTARIRVPAVVVVDADANRMTIEMPLQRVVRPMVETGVVEVPPAPTRAIASAKPTTRTYIPSARQPIAGNVKQGAIIPGNDNLRTIPREKPALRADAKVHGDVVIDGTAYGAGVRRDLTVCGNLFIQNFHRFTIPCGLHVDGDLHIRNVRQLHFCGDFKVTGNIFVSRDSSFGPIPRTARLGGQIIF